eukprot:5730281-Amphidinium_carterae.4
MIQLMCKLRPSWWRILPVPGGYEVRSSHLCRKTDGSGQAAVRVQVPPPSLEKQGWQLRQMRETVIQQTAIEPTRVCICYCSASVYSHRKLVCFKRGRKFIEDVGWPPGLSFSATIAELEG